MNARTLVLVRQWAWEARRNCKIAIKDTSNTGAMFGAYDAADAALNASGWEPYHGYMGAPNNPERALEQLRDALTAINRAFNGGGVRRMVELHQADCELTAAVANLTHSGSGLLLRWAVE